MASSIVELERVSKSFAAQTVLDDVSLTIERGEFLTLLGPSGCGKTTTLRLIAGFDEPSHGIIRIEGLDVAGVPPFRRRVNTVFQHYALFPHMTVGDNVAFGLTVKRRPAAEVERRVRTALDLVKLVGLSEKYPAQLSGGQRQRVALARALVLEPQVLLLDEPLGALDVKLRKEMQVELKNLQRRLSITFILVTHDQEEALVMSDRIAVMNRGRLEQVDRAKTVYERPLTTFVADFLGFTNFLTGTVDRAEGDHIVVTTDGGLSLAVGPGPVPAGGRIVVGIRPEKVTVLERPAGAPNVLSGTVEDAIYLGSGVRTVVRLNPKETLTVARPVPDGPLPLPGSPMTVAFEAGDTVGLEAPE